MYLGFIPIPKRTDLLQVKIFFKNERFGINVELLFEYECSNFILTEYKI